MQTPPATLLMTRPLNRSQDFLALCEKRAGRKIASVISPAMKIEPVEILPDLSPYKTLFLTSASAVTVLGDRLKGHDTIVVGARTADLARAVGARVLHVAPDVERLIASVPQFEPPALHLRGEFSHGDLASVMTSMGRPTDEAIVYRQPALPLSDAARALFEKRGKIILPLFSARSAALVRQQVPVRRDLVVIAMSPAVAGAWGPDGDIRISGEPTASAMCLATLEAI